MALTAPAFLANARAVKVASNPEREQGGNRQEQSHKQPNEPFRSAVHVRDVPSLESLVCCARWSFDPQGDLVGDADAVAFEGYYLFRMVG
jgi:hypothetical protein